MAKSVGNLVTFLSLKSAKFKTGMAQAEGSVKKYQRSSVAANRRVESSFKKIGNVVKGFGAVLGAALAGKVIFDAFNVIKEFGQAQANLGAITEGTTKDLKRFRDEAKRLGGATIFTATQVTELQTAFAKLGFSTKEIIDATEATLSLAAATGTELGEAATVVGSVIRAFGFDAMETQRVVDVMAKSFSSSALNMEKFSTAMATIAPVARSAGVTLERTTALLGILVDRGVEASTAGTGLRNVFLELSKQGITFEEAMNKINAASDKNAVALQLFGKRGATIATILAGTSGQVEILDKKLQDAGGTAKAMADKQLDTLTSSVTLLSSAWQGLLISLDEGTGIFSKAIRFFIDQLRITLNEIKDVSEVDFGASFRFIVDTIVLGGKQIGVTAKFVKEAFLAMFNKDTIKEATARFKAAIADIEAKTTELVKSYRESRNAAQEFSEVVKTGSQSAATATDNLTTSIKNQGTQLDTVGTKIDDHIKRWKIYNKVVVKTGTSLDLIPKRLEASTESMDALNKKMEEATVKVLPSLTERLGSLGEKMEGVIGSFQETWGAAINSISNAFDGFFTTQNTKLDQQAANEIRRINQSKLNETQKSKAIAKIEENLDKKKRKLARQQAKREKALALLSAVVNTASGVARAFKDFAFPVSVAIAALVAGLGAAQISTIASTPLPALAEGGLATSATLALVGEASSRSNPEVISPLNKLKGMGQTQVFIPELRVDLEEFIIEFRKTEENMDFTK